MTSSEDKYTSSLCASYGIIGAVKGKRDFSTDNHILAVKEEWWYRKIDWDVANDAKLRGIVSNQGAANHKGS